MIREAKGDDRDLGCYTCGGRKTNISSDGGNSDDKVGWNEECVIRDRNLIFGIIARVKFAIFELTEEYAFYQCVECSVALLDTQ